jgi:hypothetical protein
MDAGDDDRRWFEEIERRLTQRFRGVYIAIFFAGVCGFALVNTQRMMHDAALLPVTATIVALGAGSGGEPTMTSAFVDAEGNWHRDTQPASYHYARGEPRVGESIEYLYGVKPATGDFYAVPRADGTLKWLFGVAGGLLALAGIAFGAVVLREHDARRALVRAGQRLALETPRIGFRRMTLPRGAGGSQLVELWRLEGRAYDRARGEYIECASDWQQPPPPTLDPSRLPPLLLDPARPSRYWLPVGALRTWAA